MFGFRGISSGSLRAGPFGPHSDLTARCPRRLAISGCCDSSVDMPSCSKGLFGLDGSGIAGDDFSSWRIRPESHYQSPKPATHCLTLSVFASQGLCLARHATPLPQPQRKLSGPGRSPVQCHTSPAMAGLGLAWAAHSSKSLAALHRHRLQAIDFHMSAKPLCRDRQWLRRPMASRPAIASSKPLHH